ncbi:hypothetical protein BDA96_02G179100 [Sorghum bicolor]|uniref:Uncharacterized protein n=1 Tax=Sorghum bicolor TaxID=4558 RepID=A0A921UT78_SORBI|nr:hypothetical protein BDA96_02G179100 [Sorghum bicolor]
MQLKVDIFLVQQNFRPAHSAPATRNFVRRSAPATRGNTAIISPRASPAPSWPHPPRPPPPRLAGSPSSPAHPPAPRPHNRADAVGHAPRRELVAERPRPAHRELREAAAKPVAAAPRPPCPSGRAPPTRLLEAAAKPAARPAFRVLTAPWYCRAAVGDESSAVGDESRSGPPSPVVRTSEWVSFGFRVENAGVL